MEKVVVNTSTAKEHVAEIERCILTTSKHSKAVVTNLPFDYLPKLIVVNLFYFAVMCINAFPAKNRVSDNFFPQALVTRTNLHWGKHFQFLFGTYCEVHDEPEPSNTMTIQTHADIAVVPTGNLHRT